MNLNYLHKEDGLSLSFNQETGEGELHIYPINFEIRDYLYEISSYLKDNKKKTIKLTFYISYITDSLEGRMRDLARFLSENQQKITSFEAIFYSDAGDESEVIEFQEFIDDFLWRAEYEGYKEKIKFELFSGLEK